VEGVEVWNVLIRRLRLSNWWVLRNSLCSFCSGAFINIDIYIYIYIYILRVCIGHKVIGVFCEKKWIGTVGDCLKRNYRIVCDCNIVVNVVKAYVSTHVPSSLCKGLVCHRNLMLK
jgi:hypothetical protein